MCIFAFAIREMYEFKTYNIMRKINLLKGWMRGMMLLVLFLAVQIGASAFTGSDFASGQKYYLFNIYQAKFLGADNKLQAPNIGNPVAFTASATGFTIGSTAYTATKNSAGYYQLKSGGQFFAFEDKVADPDNPGDENRAMYLGGGVTCKTTTNDTDRSYWQLISEKEYAEWQAKKKFTVSSLNVDGMPKQIVIELNPDATEGPGATAIGNKLRESGFDVVGVSEDFNFHSNLWDAAWNNGQGNHYNATTHRGNLGVTFDSATGLVAQRSPLFNTDGLGLFYRINGDVNVATPSRESWTAWNDHYGYTGDGGDGLIAKGYRYYLITLADGTKFDLYTMHMDASDGQGDRDARASQLQQLVTAIKATDNKRPVIIIGDSNTRYTRDKVKEILIDGINADPRFTILDPWIQFGRGGVYPTYGSESLMARDLGYLKGEVVDKIWYINNEESAVKIKAETYHQDLSFVASEDVEGTSLKKGSPLCDHKPCVVTFSYEGEEVVDKSDEAYKWVGEKLEDGKTYYMYCVGSKQFLKGNVPTSSWSEANTWTVTLKSETVAQLYNNADKRTLYAKKSGLSYSIAYDTSANTVNLSTETKSIPGEDYLGVGYKLFGTNTRYINVDKSSKLSSATSNSERNDWLFISEEQFNAKQPNDYVENEVHYYSGIYQSNPTSITLQKQGEDTALDIDISKSNITGLSVDVTEYPNAIIYANKDSKVTNGKNVVVAGKAANVEFVDGAPVYVPVEFDADNISYTRKVSNKWGTIVFPANLTSNAEGNGVQYYTLVDKNDAETVLSFSEVNVLQANTPGAFVVEGADGSDVTFISGAAFVNATGVDASVVTGVDGWSMTGLYRNKEINTTEAEETYYYIASNKFWDATGITLKGAPFRSFFTTPKSEGAKSFSIRIAGADEDATGIREVAAPQLAVFAGNGQITVGANAASRVHIYNVAGAKVAQMNLGEGDTKSVNLSRGIYVVNGVKVLVK